MSTFIGSFFKKLEIHNREEIFFKIDHVSRRDVVCRQCKRKSHHRRPCEYDWEGEGRDDHPGGEEGAELPEGGGGGEVVGVAPGEQGGERGQKVEDGREEGVPARIEMGGG